MVFNLIVTCVSQKKAKKKLSILDPKIESGPVDEVFCQWHTLLSESNIKPKNAKDLYIGIPYWPHGEW